MSKVLCIGYSDFGYLLSQREWQISIHKVEDVSYGLYEDVLCADGIRIIRRFVANTPSVFDNLEEDKSEPLLPYDVKRIMITFEDQEVRVIASHDFARLFSSLEKNALGMVCVDEDAIDCKCTDDEDLSEDVVLLASCGVDLNATELP